MNHTERVEKRVRVIAYGGGGLTLEGLSSQETEVLLGSFNNGHHWVRRGDAGQIEYVAARAELPGPTEDAAMHPFWEPAGRNVPVQLEMFSFEIVPTAYEEYEMGSILIQHLCGYNYSPVAYETQADLLESLGFQCLRSRRGISGQFWEIWFLPGVWSAKGALAEAFVIADCKNGKQKMRTAIAFLRRNALFGTLDVSVQRLAQVMVG